MPTIKMAIKARVAERFRNIRPQRHGEEEYEKGALREGENELFKALGENLLDLEVSEGIDPTALADKLDSAMRLHNRPQELTTLITALTGMPTSEVTSRLKETADAITAAAEEKKQQAIEEKIRSVNLLESLYFHNNGKDKNNIFPQAFGYGFNREKEIQKAFVDDFYRTLQAEASQTPGGPAAQTLKMVDYDWSKQTVSLKPEHASIKLPKVGAERLAEQEAKKQLTIDANRESSINALKEIYSANGASPEQVNKIFPSTSTRLTVRECLEALFEESQTAAYNSPAYKTREMIDVDSNTGIVSLKKGVSLPTRLASTPPQNGDRTAVPTPGSTSSCQEFKKQFGEIMRIEKSSLEIFKSKHKEIFDADRQKFGGCFRRTKFNADDPQWDLKKIIEHAQNDKNRSRQVCVALDWMDKDGSLKSHPTTPIPDDVKKAFSDIAEESSSKPAGRSGLGD